MIHYEKEVNEYKRLPEDFLFVTPFTQTNPLVDALQLAINIFWKNIDTNDDFKRYAIFHKSEDGSSINLNESIKNSIKQHFELNLKAQALIPMRWI